MYLVDFLQTGLGLIAKSSMNEMNQVKQIRTENTNSWEEVLHLLLHDGRIGPYLRLNCARPFDAKHERMYSQEQQEYMYQ